KGSVEVLNESSPMEIGDEDSLLLSRPYSPSQVFMSSPELMEEDEQLNIDVSSKEKEELKKEEGENIKNKSENEKIICEEDKKIKEKSEQSIDNIAGIEGGEMPMDISVSSAD
uniref:Uncharacterized protein n=1 Tax=Meloidogyne javanica TaxID=6303 RepID=A0A915N9E5_MELJA